MRVQYVEVTTRGTSRTPGETVEVATVDGHPFRPCWKCGGSGYLPGYEFSDNARCWQCQTAGGRWAPGTLQDEAERIVRNRRARARRQERQAAQWRAEHEAKVAAFDAEFAKLVEAHPLVADATYAENFAAAGIPDRALAELFRLAGMVGDRRMPYDDQVERVEAAVRRLAEPVTPVVEGRIVVTGEVLTVRVDDNPFGYGSIVKTLVRDDRGFKVWGTMPSALLGSEGGAHGKRVTFTARCQASDNDPAFGFFSRPTKAAFVE